MSEQPEIITPNITDSVRDILDTIEREREREIIARRFGLYDRKETLEQIGEMLGVTRERVRQLEKGILTRLNQAADGSLPHIDRLEKLFIRHLYDLGRVARLSDLTARIGAGTGERERAHVAFIATLAPRLTIVNETDTYFYSVGIMEHHDEEKIRLNVDKIVEVIKQHGQPMGIDQLHEKLDLEHPDNVRALASVSKSLASLRDKWGLAKWPTVNPKNIRDKIFVVLQQYGKPMHFGAIAEAIKASDFKRRNVTTQAIHNELIKDGRFVLIGRGIYALKEWGFQKGTVSDIIVDIMEKEGAPLHRDEIVKRTLKHRLVRETTILLNLQSKQCFKRVSKATYYLANKV